MIQRLRQILLSNRFDLSLAPFRLNIVGIRAKGTVAGSFDDEIHVFWRDDAGKWQHRNYPATTDPGTYWLQKPMMPQGTAILKAGQYVGAYQIGKHQGRYKALVQRGGPVTVVRDYNRDSVLDFVNGQEESGFLGINIHRAERVGTTYEIDRHSAGCQVFQDAGHFAEFMQLCEIHRERHGNSFTYTLVDFREARNALIRNVAAGGSAVTLGALAAIELFPFLRKKYLTA